MRLPTSPLYTFDQYLTFERAAEERHYYVDGRIFAMAGESSAHGDISVNLVQILANQVQDTPCRVRTKDTKVLSSPYLAAGKSTRGVFSYPDLLIICGEPEHLDAIKDVVLNPTVILEVLSESTESFDRGEKFTRLQTWNHSLTDYVLVSQVRPQIEHFTRQPDGSWSYRITIGLEASVEIPSIGCALKLADVYRRVNFPEEKLPPGLFEFTQPNGTEE